MLDIGLCHPLVYKLCELVPIIIADEDTAQVYNAIQQTNKSTRHVFISIQLCIGMGIGWGRKSYGISLQAASPLLI